VRNGDNLWTIARRFELRSKEIATWNRISLDELLQPGQVLDFRYALKELTEESEMDSTDDAAVYIVRRGDSMDAIANRFGIDLQNLLRWNGLRVSELIFPGQELQVTPDTIINERL
jgi:membrane-bound lytic murein transglycosylase D